MPFHENTTLIMTKLFFFLKFGQSVTSQLSFTTSESAVSNSMTSLGVTSSTQVGLTFSDVTGIIFYLCLRISVTILYNDKSVASLQSSKEIYFAPFNFFLRFVYHIFNCGFFDFGILLLQSSL